MTKGLHPDLLEQIKSSDGSLDVRNVPDGYEVEIETRNTVYRIKGDTIHSIDGSRPEGRFDGCTYGGSMIKPHHVWVGGYPEFTVTAESSSHGFKRMIGTAISRVDVVRAL